MNKLILKQFGQYRTGTCVSAMIVRQTFDIGILVGGLGFKHGVYDQKIWDRGIRDIGLQGFDFGLLVSIKDPYAWITSMRRFKGPHIGRQINFNVDTERRVARLVKMSNNFNKAYKSWLSLDMPKYVVQYDRLISDLAVVMDEIGEQFNLTKKEEPKPIRNVVGPGENIMPTGIFDPTYYLEKKYLDDLTAEEKQIVTDNIDWELLKPYGYEPVHST